MTTRSIHPILHRLNPYGWYPYPACQPTMRDIQHVMREPRLIVYLRDGHVGKIPVGWHVVAGKSTGEVDHVIYFSVPYRYDHSLDILAWRRIPRHPGEWKKWLQARYWLHKLHGGEG